MAVQISVLYEGQAASSGSVFGPHRLVVQCVADQLGIRADDLKGRLVGLPKKGNANVIRECREGVCRRGRMPTVAVYDEDRIRNFVKLPKDACRSAVVSALKKDCPSPASLRVVLIGQNTEDVLRAIRLVDPTLVSDRTFEKAIQEKDANARDSVFSTAVYYRDPSLRARILEQHPSFAYLVTKIAGLMRA